MNLNELENFDMMEHLSKALMSIQETLNKITINFDVEKLKDSMDQQLTIIKKISKDGYITPRCMDVDNQTKFFNCRYNKERKEIFTNFFIKNKEEALIGLKKEFYSYKELFYYRKPYAQAYFNFNHCNYYACCILLTALLEGLIRKYADISSKDKNIMGKLNQYLNKKYKNRYTLLFQDKTGIKNFIEIFYASIDEKCINNKNYFNRNVLMHGLEYNRFNKTDAIKLFNVIDILNGLLLEKDEV